MKDQPPARRRLVVSLEDEFTTPPSSPPQPPPPPPPWTTAPAPLLPPGPARPRSPYASRGLRFSTSILDGLLLSPLVIVIWIVAAIVIAAVLTGAINQGSYTDSSGQLTSTDDAVLTGGLLAALWVYLGAYLLTSALPLVVLTWCHARSGEHNGKSWGKQITKIRVVREDGLPVSFGLAFRRGVLFPLLLSLPLLLGTLADAIWPFFDDRKRRLVDVWCGTVVLPVTPRPSLPGPQTAWTGGAPAPSRPLVPGAWAPPAAGAAIALPGPYPPPGSPPPRM